MPSSRFLTISNTVNTNNSSDSYRRAKYYTEKKDRACAFYATSIHFLVHFYGYYKHAIQAKITQPKQLAIKTPRWISSLKQTKNSISLRRLSALQFQTHSKRKSKTFQFNSKMKWITVFSCSVELYSLCVCCFLFIAQLMEWIGSRNRALRRFNWSETLGLTNINDHKHN